jgi:hypothetical protein
MKRLWKEILRNNLIVAVLCLLFSSSCFALTSEDAYIKTGRTQWILGTASVEKTIALEKGMLVTKSFRNKISGHELSSSNSTGPWKLVGAKTSKLKQGELQLDLTLQRDSLAVTKTYVVYPGSSIIREWAVFKNAGTTPLKVIEPEFLNASARLGDPAALDFHWMTGGNNQPGSWMLRTEAVSTEKPRTFDSYDPFPDMGVCGPFSGIQFTPKILLNDKQVWPAPGWQYAPTATNSTPFDVSVEIIRGDKLIFLADFSLSTTAFDPTIAYEDGEIHAASKEFSSEQGRNGWRYQYVDNGKFVDLIYDAAANEWRRENHDAKGAHNSWGGGPFIGADDQNTGLTFQGGGGGELIRQWTARVWTAPKSGNIRITGSTCSTNNGRGEPSWGSSTYAPWVALYDRDTKDGLFIGWDYFGHWASSYALNANGGVTAQLRVAGHKQTLAPGQSLTTPKAFVGLFRDDLDNAGNELLDWQYRYLWDYTREGWFPAIRMLNDWYSGTGYTQPGGGRADMDSIFRHVFRFADLMRYVGADVYHRDWGWWDRAGDWNGPDFRTTGKYLRKYGMGQLIYSVLYSVDSQSKVGREHPDWLLGGGTLDMSRPEVVEFIKGQLDGFVERWGDFEWRNDGAMTSAKDGDDTPMLGQDHGMREILQRFLDTHPRSAFQAVNGGGNYAGYDYVRYASGINFSDGAVGIIGDYWASLLLPPDKINDIEDHWRPDQYNKALWRGLLSMNFDMVRDTRDLAKLEGVRELIDIYHYLQSKGVVGRWVRVYRPVVTGDEPTMYFQRLSKDGKRGIIIPKRPAPGAVTIQPKGLLPKESYVVSYQESGKRETRTGADLMENGIMLPRMPAGELIYLNLPMHPGSKLDTEPPTPPSTVIKRRNDNMGYPGIELEWKPGADNNWISYYEIFRNGLAIDKVAKGTFYFDHSAGADLAATYEVRTVDGAGNVSARVAVPGVNAKPSRIIDDAPGGGITFSPQWRHASEEPLVAYNGTITSSSEKGATAEVVFEGKRVLWFTKLGPENGKAAVSIDGGPAEIVDTYSADDIWGVCAFRRQFPTAGRHTIRIEVLGDRNTHPSEQSKDTFIYVDGIRVEME